MSALGDLARDLAAEQDALAEIVQDLGDADWARETPAVGWSVADQIAHLAYFDAAATQAIEDPEGFVAARENLVRAAMQVGVDEYTLAPFRALRPSSIHSAWLEASRRLNLAATHLRAEQRLPWYGPDMKARSFLTARLMETWAHGTDVADALGASLEETERLEHIVRLGLNTREWSYRVRGEDVPAERVRVELTAPSGQIWSLGPEDAEDVVRGPARDFCLVVTQRRHVDDTALISGEWGRHWLLRAQAFAGPPTSGPAARSS